MAVIGPPTKPANQPSRADNNQPSNQPAEPTTTEPSRRPTSRAGQPIHPLNFTQPQASNQPTSNLRQLPTSSFSSRLCQLQFAMLSGAKPVSPPASMAFFKLCIAQCSQCLSGAASRRLFFFVQRLLCAGNITRPFALEKPQPLSQAMKV